MVPSRVTDSHGSSHGIEPILSNPWNRPSLSRHLYRDYVYERKHKTAGIFIISYINACLGSYKNQRKWAAVHESLHCDKNLLVFRVPTHISEFLSPILSNPKSPILLFSTFLNQENQPSFFSKCSAPFCWIFPIKIHMFCGSINLQYTQCIIPIVTKCCTYKYCIRCIQNVGAIETNVQMWRQKVEYENTHPQTTIERREIINILLIPTPEECMEKENTQLHLD